MSIILRRRRLGHSTCLGIKAASTTGIAVLRNDQVWPAVDGYIFRWGCTSSIPNREDVTTTTVNSARSIHWCSNKAQGRWDMQAADVSVPFTCLPEDVERQMLGEEGEDNFPIVERVTNLRLCVARPVQHSQGRHLFVGDILECTDWCCSRGGGYISDLIDKVAEYRVMVCQNRVVWVAKKTPGNPADVAWNVAQGGRFDNVRWGEWPMHVIQQALRAANVSGTDFCGVDVMETADRGAYVLEVNSAPSQTSAYRQQCLAKAFDYIVLNGKRHFTALAYNDELNWKNIIHPAIWSRNRD